MPPEGGRTRTIHGFVRVRVSDVTRVGGPRDARSVREDPGIRRLSRAALVGHWALGLLGGVGPLPSPAHRLHGVRWGPGGAEERRHAWQDATTGQGRQASGDPRARFAALPEDPP